MKNLLALVGAVVVLVAGLGWYLGWYKVGVSNGTGDVKFDLKKVESDLKKEKETVGQFIKDHENGKGVPAVPTGSIPNSDGTFAPPSSPLQLPPLPSPPSSTPGTVPSTIVIPPPPPFAPGQ
jgi:hypothetical protein